MDSNNIIIAEYLNRYIELGDPRYAVLLKGKWGCGKTFFIQKLLKEWDGQKNSDDDGYLIKPIYVSLNGVSSIKSLTYLLNKEISPILYSKGAQIAKKVGKAFCKGMFKMDFDLNDDNKTDITFQASPLDIFTNENESIKGRRVIVLDDWERCKIPAYELFGYINNFIEHQKCKVILIGDDEKLDAEEKDTYLRIKEKLIGQTFSIKEDLDSAITQFLVDISSNELSVKILTENKELIRAIFKAGKTQNLRILRQSFLDFERLLNVLSFDAARYDKEFKYKSYIINILTYYILTYCEYKSGNIEIVNFQNYKAYHEATKEKKDTELRDLSQKYENLLRSKNIKSASESISIKFLIEFIESGTFFVETMNSIIERQNEWLFSREVQSWEILYYRYNLTNKIFEENIKIIKDDFFSNRLKAVFEVLHISALLLFYSKEGAISRIGEKKIKKQAIKTINRIYKENPTLNTVYTSLRDESVRIADFADDKSEVFIEIFNFAHTKKEELIAKRIEIKRIRFLESLEDSSVNQFESVICEIAQAKKIGSESFGIFKGVSVSKFGKQILKLSIQSKFDLKYFFQNRYCVEGSRQQYKLGENQKDDLDFIIALQAFLERQIKKLEFIDKHAVKDIVRTLGSIIEKMSDEKTEK